MVVWRKYYKVDNSDEYEKWKLKSSGDWIQILWENDKFDMMWQKWNQSIPKRSLIVHAEKGDKRLPGNIQKFGCCEFFCPAWHVYHAHGSGTACWKIVLWRYSSTGWNCQQAAAHSHCQQLSKNCASFSKILNGCGIINSPCDQSERFLWRKLINISGILCQKPEKRANRKAIAQESTISTEKVIF